MVIGRLPVVLLTAILVTLPSPAAAQVLSCGRYESLADCNSRLRLAQDTMAQQMRKTAEQRAQVMVGIQQSRDKFWATYPDKLGADKAKQDFAYWLWVKDFYYLRENLKAPVTKDPRTGRQTSTGVANVLDTTFGLTAPIDDGIRQVALIEFEDWVNAVRAKLFEGHTSNSTDDAFMQGLLASWWIGPKFMDAVKAGTDKYIVYMAQRDWWEFDHVNRAPAGFDTPETYGVYLYSRFHHLPVASAAANYKKMTELLGAQRVQTAVKRVMDAPKRDDGGLVVTVEAIRKGPGGGEMIDYDKAAPPEPIGAFADPVRVMEMLATQDDDRRYLLDLLHRHAPDLRKLDPATTWTWADIAYKRLVLAFGEPQLLAASRAVRVAPKRLATGGVMTVNELGVKRTEPIETLEDLLVTKDPRGYVKAALIFAKDLDTAAAVDAAYQTYVAARGEPAVLDAARRRAVNKPQLTFQPELQFIDAEMTTPTPARPAPAPQTESPQYLAWKRFAPGASASYINRNLGQVSLRRPDLEGGSTVGIRTRYLLRSITPERADLFLTEIAYDPPPRSTAHPPRDTEIAYPARLDATPTARGAATANTPLQSGEETLTIAGKQIATHWQAEQMPGATRAGCGPRIVTTWRSDEVPGGLVRETVDSICRDNRYPPGSDAVIRTVRETLLESFEASGSASGTRPIPAASVNASILPLPVPASLPGQPPGTTAGQPAGPAAAPTVDRRVFDRNMGATAPGAATAAPPSRAAPPPASSQGASVVTVPAGTVIAVMTSGAIGAAANRPGDSVRGTIVQPVVVDGLPAIPGNTTVALQVVAADGGLTVQLSGITINGETKAASSSQVALDPQTASANAMLERAQAARRAGSRELPPALAARVVVLSGPKMNLPSGTRLMFTLAAPMTLDRVTPRVR
jgi:hypothetical protein